MVNSIVVSGLILALLDLSHINQRCLRRILSLSTVIGCIRNSLELSVDLHDDIECVKVDQCSQH